jgi:hypothetical protein
MFQRSHIAGGGNPFIVIWIFLGFAVCLWQLGRRLLKGQTPSIGEHTRSVLYLRSFKYDRRFFNKWTYWLVLGGAFNNRRARDACT